MLYIAKAVNLAILAMLTNVNSINMTKRDTVPQTVLDYGTRINADLSSLNGRGTIMVANFDYIIVGLDNVPYMLFATTAFNQYKVTSNIRKDLYSIKRIVFQPSFEYDKLKNSNCNLPSWIENYKSLEYLRLSHVDVRHLEFLQGLPIKFLQMNDVTINETDYLKVVKNIEILKNLKAIIYDSSFPISLIQILKLKHPEYTFYSYSDKIQMSEVDKELGRIL